MIITGALVFKPLDESLPWRRYHDLRSRL